MLAEIKKVYYDKNADKLNEQHKENKEVIIKNAMEYYDENKEQEFYNDNKERILKERSDYYKENYKTKIAAQRQKKETCECGMVITHYYLKKHKKSSRHKLLMEKSVETF